MTIRLSCSEGHAQDVVIDPFKTGSAIAASFINTYKAQVAALLDGTSTLYVVPPTPRRCQVGGCDKVIRAEVIE